SGTSGVLVPNVPWVINAEGTNSWGAPGAGLGPRSWPGPDGFLDFHIAFTNLPDDVDIDPSFGSDCGTGAGTIVCVADSAGQNAMLWNPVLDTPDSISFYAPQGSSLDNGDLFFVNIGFTGAVSTVDFNGSFTQTGVPEPATFAL